LSATSGKSPLFQLSKTNGKTQPWSRRNNASGLFLAWRWCVGIKNLELGEALVVRNFREQGGRARRMD
jgi:hypothetical protein